MQARQCSRAGVSGRADRFAQGSWGPNQTMRWELWEIRVLSLAVHLRGEMLSSQIHRYHAGDRVLGSGLQRTAL